MSKQNNIIDGLDEYLSTERTTEKHQFNTKYYTQKAALLASVINNCAWDSIGTFYIDGKKIMSFK